ncbi:hypothetical protein Tco_1040469, partial [Tanacetum coccineum]
VMSVDFLFPRYVIIYYTLGSEERGNPKTYLRLEKPICLGRANLKISLHQRASGDEVVELYFVRTEYQLAGIFTKALCRERIEFLIDKLGMRCFTPETLKALADEAEE